MIPVCTNRYNETNNLSGFWNGSSYFYEQSDLDLFLLYISDTSFGCSELTGYILVKNPEGIIINNPVKIKLDKGYSLNTNVCQVKKYNIVIDWVEDEGYDYFPSKQQLYYYPNKSKLVFVADEEVKCVLYKNNEMTDVANTLPKLNKKKNDQDGSSS